MPFFRFLATPIGLEPMTKGRIDPSQTVSAAFLEPMFGGAFLQTQLITRSLFSHGKPPPRAQKKPEGVVIWGFRERGRRFGRLLWDASTKIMSDEG